jgi:alpha-ribazole phosphatase/probable phosphoglycerate mutase
MTSAERSIITVRHSVTGHNSAQIISGRLDEPLNDEGRRLASAYANENGRIVADVVVVSPMRRAIDTATIITGLEPSRMLTSELCLERDYGELAGLSPEAVKGYADRVEYLEAGGIRHSLNPPGGETFGQVRIRADAFVAWLASLSVGSVLVVSHQTFLQQVHGNLLGLDTHGALALDIRTLQTDRFRLGPDGVTHEPIHPGMGHHRSW